MKKNILLICVLFLLILGGCGVKDKNTNLEDGNYQIDVLSSRLEWNSKRFLMPSSHYGIVNILFGAVEVKDGLIKNGNFVFDMSTITSEDLISTENMKINLENHLKSSEFFHVIEYPQSKFVIKNSELLNVGKYKITGDLTIKNISNEITFEMNIYKNSEGKIIGESEFFIDRTLWGIKYDSNKFFADLGDRAIDDKIGFKLRMYIEE